MNAPDPVPGRRVLLAPALAKTDLALRLKRAVQGEVLFDRATRGRYSTDASIYQVEPVGVVVPRTEDDACAAIDVARELGTPILPRGAGSSQCGQTVGAALVIDNSKWLRNVVEFDRERATAVVQPGITLDALNAWLRPHGLWYPVDVSTSAQATLGGMAGNNSCGSRSIEYGNMVHNVVGIDAVLADGTQAYFGTFGDARSGATARGDMTIASHRVREIVSGLHALAERERDEIRRVWPSVMRRVGGYNLDVFEPRSERPYTRDGSVNLAHLLVGSEGTLAYFRRLKLALAPLPQDRVLGVVNFPTFHGAMDSAQHIVTLGPTAVELVDRTMIDLARANPAFRPVIDAALAGEPQAILLTEFTGATRAESLAKLARLVALMGDLGLPGSVVELTDERAQKELWEVRKAGLNIMMSMRGDGKPVSFIEDCAVPLEHLAEYTSALTEIFARHGTRGTWYAHASVGTLHVRPVLDMRRGGPEGGAAKMRAIAEEAAGFVRRYKGAFSGEHGDGLVRSEWVAWQFGPRLTRAFEQVKDLFDPQGLMNPGKIVRASKMDDASLFRFKPGYAALPLRPALDWSAWNVETIAAQESWTAPGTGNDPAAGLAKAVEMCNNNGHCRKFDAGTMCPSFRATRDEQHLTRGRANTLRLALSGQLGQTSAADALASEPVQAALDLCVSCKGCRRDCPTGIDMARMKIEARHQLALRSGVSLRERLVAYLPRYAPSMSRLPALANLRNDWPLLRRLGERWLGLAAGRSLPAWAPAPFLRTAQARAAAASHGTGAPEVVLFVDTFNNYFEPDNAAAALAVLQAAGRSVHIARAADRDARPLCCGRTFLAAGLVEQAREEAQRLIDAVAPYVERGVPVVGLEPSCLLTLRDEFLVLRLDARAQRVADSAFLLAEYLEREARANRLALPLRALPHARALVHGHCHEKAFDVLRPVLTVLGWIPGLRVEAIESSCCGMAGSFGYEAEHHAVSLQMGELSLLPAVRAAAPDTLLVADGTSCRHQVADGTGRSARHVARVLARALAVP
jgi:FAD/FMN-containing dehydrogenase/Fe-S oxidoreductase